MHLFTWQIPHCILTLSVFGVSYGGPEAFTHRSWFHAVSIQRQSSGGGLLPLDLQSSRMVNIHVRWNFHWPQLHPYLRRGSSTIGSWFLVCFPWHIIWSCDHGALLILIGCSTQCTNRFRKGSGGTPYQVVTFHSQGTSPQPINGVPLSVIGLCFKPRIWIAQVSFCS